MLSKNFDNKNVLLNYYYWLMKKELRKLWLICDIENWLWKSNFVTFWNLPIKPILKINNYLWICWFSSKNLSNFVPPVWRLNNPYYHKCKCKPTFHQTKDQNYWLRTLKMQWKIVSRSVVTHHFSKGASNSLIHS